MCLYSTYWAEWEKKNLAPYAIKSSDKEFTKRKYEEKVDGGILDPSGMRSRYRTPFQIDKDRILNSTAFRRLEYKTQMFVSHEGDHYRTRLTHTLEVADLARYIARSMRLNEDLVEAIALGHDLGHTPFGHAGEEALDEIMKDSGDHFYHNIQGIRIVDYLESGYDWDRRGKEMGYGRGMNLTHAVREGILKHTNRGLKEEERVSDWSKFDDLDFDKPCHLEGQVVALSDEISQRIHDLEDGLRSMLLSKDELMHFISENIDDSVVSVEEITEEDINEVVTMWKKKAKMDIDKSDVENLRKIIEKCKKGEIAKLLLLDGRLSKMEKILKGDIKVINRELSEDDIWNISRLIKYKQLYKGIASQRSSIGNILAFIRGIYIGNAIENSYRNCSELLEGKEIPDEDCKDRLGLGQVREEKIRCEIIIDERRGRGAEIKLFRDAGEKPTHELETEDYHIEWINKSKNIEETQVVKVKMIGEDKESKKEIRRYMEIPIEQVQITLIKEDLVSFSEEWRKFDEKLKKFIEKRMYRNPMVRRMNEKGKFFIKQIYERFYEDPLQLHERVWRKYRDEKIKSPVDLDESKIEEIKKRPEFKQLICEHLSGMTDRYITREYEKLFGIGSIIEEKPELYYPD